MKQGRDMLTLHLNVPTYLVAHNIPGPRFTTPHYYTCNFLRLLLFIYVTIAIYNKMQREKYGIMLQSRLLPGHVHKKNIFTL